jgi:hypothetical protein
MVGMAGFEPATPTMSTLFPCRNVLLFWEKSSMLLVVSGIKFILCSSFSVRCAKEHYVIKTLGTRRASEDGLGYT